MWKSVSRWQIVSALVLLSGAAWIWASKAPPGSTTSGLIPAPRQGFLAPDFSLTTSSGNTIQLSSLRGRPVLINMWASWCLPCRAEMPALQEVYEENTDQGFMILAVNATDQDSATDALNFAQELGLTFPILFDEHGEVSRLYELRALPTSYFVDSTGVIRDIVVGGPMSEASLRIRIKQLFERGKQEVIKPGN